MYNAIKIAAVILLICVCAPAGAKTRHAGNNSGNTHTRGLLDGAGAKRLPPAEIEKRFRPFLEERVMGRQSGFGSARGAGAAVNPNTRDLIALMRSWDNLTPEFHALYKEAMAIPGNYDYFISPGGKFKIYYTTAGRNAVDAADAIGYGTNGQTWKARVSSPNGVPDYIDEAAFALDSAWSMEIGRFRFQEPIAHTEPDNSRAQYKVLITFLGDEYGVTYPHDKLSGAGIGISSHIEINSALSSPEWDDYNPQPYAALKVTCAHEFFHAVQYAMVRTHNITYEYKLDDFPLSWLEGSAVLMEELAYPEVNDYLQYIDVFFKNPQRPLLVDDYYAYSNSILFKYLYEKTNRGDSIGFVRTMHTNNYDTRTPFHDNIERVSASHAGKDWAETLNGFHCESYFTGARARRPWAFVTDAERMDSWAIPAASISGGESKTITPYSAGFFRYTPQDGGPDTLTLDISGQTDPSISGKTWGAGVLVMEKNDSVSIVPVQMNKNGVGSFKLAGWKGKSGCLLVVTNASPDTERKITVARDGEGFVNPGQDAVTVSHNVIRQSTATMPVRISGGGVTEAKVYSLDGKLVWSGKNAANDAIEWNPEQQRRLTPGTYFISATSNSGSRKKTLKRKIMVLP